MSLSFLTPRPGDSAPARSPLIDPALPMGAVTEVRDGWEVIASFGDPGAERAACADAVGFADLSPLPKLELLRDVAAELTLGLATPLEDGWRCPVRRDRSLLLGPSAWRSVGAEARTCDLTGSLAAIAIAGPLARETLARFCALDLRDRSLPLGGFRPGSIGRTPGFLLREGPERFLALFGAAYGAYLWEVVADAARGLGGAPVGAEALPAAAGEPARA